MSQELPVVNASISDDNDVDAVYVITPTTHDLEKQEASHYDFVEETLQITDIHETLEETSSGNTYVNVVESSFLCTYQPTAEGPCPVNQLLNDSSGFQNPRVSFEAPNLQDELASLGFNPFTTEQQENSFEQTTPCDEEKSQSLNTQDSEDVKSTEETKEISDENFKRGHFNPDLSTDKSLDKEYVESANLVTQILPINLIENSSYFNLHLSEEAKPTENIFGETLQEGNSCLAELSVDKLSKNPIRTESPTPSLKSLTILSSSTENFQSIDVNEDFSPEHKFPNQNTETSNIILQEKNNLAADLNEDNSVKNTADSQDSKETKLDEENEERVEPGKDILMEENCIQGVKIVSPYKNKSFDPEPCINLEPCTLTYSTENHHINDEVLKETQSNKEAKAFDETEREENDCALNVSEKPCNTLLTEGESCSGLESSTSDFHTIENPQFSNPQVSGETQEEHLQKENSLLELGNSDSSNNQLIRAEVSTINLECRSVLSSPITNISSIDPSEDDSAEVKDNEQNRDTSNVISQEENNLATQINKDNSVNEAVDSKETELYEENEETVEPEKNEEILFEENYTQDVNMESPYKNKSLEPKNLSLAENLMSINFNAEVLDEIEYIEETEKTIYENEREENDCALNLSQERSRNKLFAETESHSDLDGHHPGFYNTENPQSTDPQIFEETKPAEETSEKSLQKENSLPELSYINCSNTLPMKSELSSPNLEKCSPSRPSCTNVVFDDSNKEDSGEVEDNEQNREAPKVILSGESMHAIDLDEDISVSKTIESHDFKETVLDEEKKETAELDKNKEILVKENFTQDIDVKSSSNNKSLDQEPCTNLESHSLTFPAVNPPSLNSNDEVLEEIVLPEKADKTIDETEQDENDSSLNVSHNKSSKNVSSEKISCSVFESYPSHSFHFENPQFTNPQVSEETKPTEETFEKSFQDENRCHAVVSVQSFDFNEVVSKDIEHNKENGKTSNAILQELNVFPPHLDNSVNNLTLEKEPGANLESSPVTISSYSKSETIDLQEHKQIELVEEKLENEGETSLKEACVQYINFESSSSEQSVLTDSCNIEINMKSGLLNYPTEYSQASNPKDEVLEEMISTEEAKKLNNEAVQEENICLGNIINYNPYSDLISLEVDNLDSNTSPIPKFENSQLKESQEVFYEQLPKSAYCAPEMNHDSSSNDLSVFHLLPENSQSSGLHDEVMEKFKHAEENKEASDENLDFQEPQDKINESMQKESYTPDLSPSRKLTMKTQPYNNVHDENNKSMNKESTCDPEIILAPDSMLCKEDSVKRHHDISESNEFPKREGNTKQEIMQDMSMTCIYETAGDMSVTVGISDGSSDQSCTAVNKLTNSSSSLELTVIDSSHGHQAEESSDGYHRLSHSSSDFMNYSNIQETNDFINRSDQKECDAVYLPLADIVECGNQSLTETTLQSFMEITMANTNPALLEQSVVYNLGPHTFKPSNLNRIFENYTENGDSKNNCFDESESKMKLDREVRKWNFENISGSSSESNADYSIHNLSHEMMQQSMSNYVTSQSLRLTIPESDQISSLDDEKLRQQCERQTENVLLMKWPAQFYDQLSTLREQNQLLSEKLEASKQKDLYICNLKEENEMLSEKIKEIGIQSEDVKKQNLLLAEKIKESDKDREMISILKEENNKLTLDLNRFRDIENDLNDLKVLNNELSQNLQQKGNEVQALSDSIKGLEQDLLTARETVNDFDAQKEKFSKLTTEVSEKEECIKRLSDNNIDLEKGMISLNEQLEELREIKNQYLEIKVVAEQEKLKWEEVEKLNFSLQEQVLNLNSQNEMLWNELRVSTRKEEGLYLMREEKLLLEDKMARMTREMKEVEKIKLENQRFSEELINKNDEISRLVADKKKFKSSLMKANDKLNELESENEQLQGLAQELELELKSFQGEKQDLLSKIESLHKNEEERSQTEEHERIALLENISTLSEYINSLVTENSLLWEQVKSSETLKETLGDIEKQNEKLKKEVVKSRLDRDEIQTENKTLLALADNLRDTVKNLTEELEIKNNQCNKVNGLEEENNQLISKNKYLTETIEIVENEKELFLRDLCSLGETISSLLVDKDLLCEQLMVVKEKSEEIAQLVNEKENLTQQLLHRQQCVSELEQSNSSLLVQLHNAKEKDGVVADLEDLTRELESHISSLNEELMSEMAKNHSLSVVNENLESKLSKITEEQCYFKNRSSSLEENLKDVEFQTELVKKQHLEYVTEKEDIIQGLTSEQRSLQSLLEAVTEKASSLEVVKDELTNKLQDTQDKAYKLEEEIDNLTKLLESKKDLELQLSNVTEEKVELESKLATVIAELKQLDVLQEENRKLSSEMLKVHEMGEENIKILQNEKIDLEIRVTNLSSSVAELQCARTEMENHIKDNTVLKEMMVKEIKSLTGQVEDDLHLSSTSHVYQKLMVEFLNKEREVIFAVQSDCEEKTKTKQAEIVQLLNSLEEREMMINKLEEEITQIKNDVSQNVMTISNLENDLQEIREELVFKGNEMTDIKNQLVQAENKKEALAIELKNLQDSDIVPQLEEQILLLKNEINGKTNEIFDLEREIENMRLAEKEILKRSETESLLVNQYQNTIDELTSKLKKDQELFLELNLQIEKKNDEIRHLYECMEMRKREIDEYVKRIEILETDNKRILQIESDIEFFSKSLDAMKDELDISEFISQISQKCRSLSGIMQMIALKWTSHANKLHLCNDDLKMELTKRTEDWKTLETELNRLNEELKSNQMLYDENLLQLKEDIDCKNRAITDLTEANAKLIQENISAAQKISDLAKEDENNQKIQEEMIKLKEENMKFSEGFDKFNFFKEVNRKLSLEIEELSRSIKFEKLSNLDLKSKHDSATNQIAELKKKNFSLEDKIDILESKLQNHNVLSSIKIAFPYGINTVDKQVTFINEKLLEFEELQEKLGNLTEEHNNLKLEHEKSKEYIKRQEEKLSKILKRELDLKKQIACTSQSISAENKLLEGVKPELFSLFEGHVSSLPEVITRIKELIKENNSLKENKHAGLEEVEQELEEARQENKDLDEECEMMNKHIKQQEELLTSALKREEELKKNNAELKSQISIQAQTGNKTAGTENLEQLYVLFPEKPNSLNDALDSIKTLLAENQSLKEKISESQDEFADLDKECEDMFKQYQVKEKELEDVLKREAMMKSDFETKEVDLEGRIRSLTAELGRTKQEISTLKAPECQCEDLKERLVELKLDVADRNAKITALELRLEADNFPVKKKVIDLEKTLEQAKHKIAELKGEVRRYQEQMHEVTVGMPLRTECERCRLGSTTAQDHSVQTSPAADLLAKKDEEIKILKTLCKARHNKIAELKQTLDAKPRSHRSALKEGKENNVRVPQSPTKFT